MTDEKINKIKKDYKEGFKYSEIENKHSITHSKLVSLIRKYKWKRTSNRSKVQKGNKNAVGNKGGTGAPKQNQNALVTGEYQTIFKDALDDEEQKIYDSYTIEDKKEALLEELKILTIREYRMSKTINKLKNSKEMVISSILKTNHQNTKFNNENYVTTITHADNTTDKIQKIEEALTRVQEAKRRCIDSLHKIENDNRKLELELTRLEMEASKEDSTNDEDVEDDSFIKALEDNTEDVWADYEEEKEEIEESASETK